MIDDAKNLVSLVALSKKPGVWEKLQKWIETAP